MSVGLAPIQASDFVQGAKKRIWAPLYDTALITNTTTRLEMFTVPRGQGTGSFVVSGPKNFADTNMSQSKQLPAGQAFEVRGMALSIWPSTNGIAKPGDAQEALSGCQLTVRVNDDVKYQGPGRFVTGGIGIDAFALTTAAATVSMARNGINDPRAIFVFHESPWTIPSGVQFEAVLEWGTAPGTTGAVPVTIAFWGYRHGVINA